MAGDAARRSAPVHPVSEPRVRKRDRAPGDHAAKRGHLGLLFSAASQVATASRVAFPSTLK
jgi:hypothetical protein